MRRNTERPKMAQNRPTVKPTTILLSFCKSPIDKGLPSSETKACYHGNELTFSRPLASTRTSRNPANFRRFIPGFFPK